MRCIMWGRESINTPIKNKKKGKAAEQPGQFGGNGVFADALTSALDVMAFTQDFDLSSATQNPNSGPNVQVIYPHLTCALIHFDYLS